ncbi:MAG: hypothetical protein HY673_06160 [Chloroflexi bacterium]|nr:hypothetical protein [Chloroflexota bacterium]
MTQTQWQVQGEEMDFEKASAAYPEIPSTVMVEIEAMRRGVKLSHAARKSMQGLDLPNPDYNQFSGSFDDPDPQPAQGIKMPKSFCLRKDDIMVSLRQNTTSPYTIDIRDNRFIFVDDRLGPTLLEEVYFVPRSKYLSRTFPDGTSYERVVRENGRDSFTFVISLYCEFWKSADQCKFCEAGTSLEMKRKRGLKFGLAPPKVVARVIKEVFENEPRFRHLNVSGGTILDSKKEADIHCAYLNAIGEAFGGVWYPAHLTIVAREEEYLKRVHQTGIPAMHMNMEVWDERLFNIFCPGKAKLIGHEEWIRRLIKGAEIFGRGNVTTQFVAGLEILQPWGFKEVHSAVKNTLQGCDFLMEHDVLPRFNIFRSLAGSELGGQASPPLEYCIELFRGFTELLEQHKFRFVYPPPTHCRACDSQPVYDLWDYLHKEETAPKAA